MLRHGIQFITRPKTSGQMYVLQGFDVTFDLPMQFRLLTVLSTNPKWRILGAQTELVKNKHQEIQGILGGGVGERVAKNQLPFMEIKYKYPIRQKVSGHIVWCFHAAAQQWRQRTYDVHIFRFRLDLIQPVLALLRDFKNHIDRIPRNDIGMRTRAAARRSQMLQIGLALLGAVPLGRHQRKNGCYDHCTHRAIIAG